MAVRKRRSSAAASLSLATLLALPVLPLPMPASGQGAAQQRSQASSRMGLPGPSDDLLVQIEGIYKDIHANPEPSMQEWRTAGIAAKWLREQGYDVTEGVGGTGVVGLLRNGEGPTVIRRCAPASRRCSRRRVPG